MAEILLHFNKKQQLLTNKDDDLSLTVDVSEHGSLMDNCPVAPLTYSFGTKTHMTLK